MVLDNCIELVFSLMTVAVLVPGILIISFDNAFLDGINALFRYGKLAQNYSITFINSIEMHKSKFWHFYAFAVYINLTILIDMFNIFYRKLSLTSFYNMLLNLLIRNRRCANITPIQLCLVMALMTIQSLKRYYEVRCVSVFSKHSKINIFHYLAGYIHYFGAALAIISQSAGYCDERNDFSIKECTVLDIIAVFGALLALLMQFQSHKILANIRCDDKGHIVYDKYGIPYNGLFKWVSSPHLFTEILFYVFLTVLLLRNSTWYYVLFWVLSNQIITAYLSHKWYNNTYKKYPKNRKVLIPYVF